MADGINVLETQKNVESIFYDFENRKHVNATIKSGSGNLAKGTLLGIVTATGKYTYWDPNAEDGSQNIAGVLGDPVDATSEDVKGLVWIEGKFKKSKLVAVPSGATIPEGSVNGFIVIYPDVE